MNLKSEFLKISESFSYCMFIDYFYIVIVLSITNNESEVVR